MQEVFGDFWDYPARIKLITTNGDVRVNGMAVMGRGIAQQAVSRFPDIADILGQRLLLQQRSTLPSANFEPKVCFLYHDKRDAVGYWSFPVKYHWQQKASFGLIVRSVKALDEIARAGTLATFLLPRPGCGNGGLEWKDVRELCKNLPDNVLIIDRP